MKFVTGGETPRQAGAELARLLADALQRREAGAGGTPAANVDPVRLRGLLATLSADAGAMESFFPALGRALKARGLGMPALGADASRATAASSDLLGRMSTAASTATLTSNPSGVPEGGPAFLALPHAGGGEGADAATAVFHMHVPAELMPLLATLDLALAPPTPGAAAEVDQEALAEQLEAQLHELLGESPREASERLLDVRIRARAARRVEVAMRRHGLVPAADAPVDDDSFWGLVDEARRHPGAFVARLHALPRERLATFYWEHAAAVGELRRAGLADQGGKGAGAGGDLAAQVVARGHEAHAAAVGDPAGVARDPAAASVDLGAEAARIFAERFGEPLAPGL